MEIALDGAQVGDIAGMIEDGAKLDALLEEFPHASKPQSAAILDGWDD